MPAKTAEVEELLRKVVGGHARYKASRSERDTFKGLLDAKAAANRYALQINAYNAAPNIYTFRCYLKLIAEGLDKIRKYVIVLDDPSRVLCELNLAPPQALDVLGAEAQAIDVKTQGQ